MHATARLRLRHRHRRATDVTFVGAGDIASSGSGDDATANLLDAIPGTVFTIGDNVYPNGTLSEFNAYYAPTWGRHKSRTIPVIGNHEYNTGNAQAYFTYFGAAAGDPAKGYYSTNLGSWHVIVLNSNCSYRLVRGRLDTGAMAARGSRREYRSLHGRAVPRSRASRRASSHGSSTLMAPFWNALYDYNADLVLNGHDHDYERFARQNPTGGGRLGARHPGVRRRNRAASEPTASAPSSRTAWCAALRSACCG